MRYLLLLMFLTVPIFAQEYNLNYGLGVFLRKSNDVADVKILSINRTDSLGGFFQEKVEAGIWIDSAKHLEARKDNVYLSYSVGIRADLPNTYIESYWGLLANLYTDSYSGSHVNFVNDTGMGVKDSLGRMIGIYYKHISNAGLNLPNKGRDFILLKIGIAIP